MQDIIVSNDQRSRTSSGTVAFQRRNSQITHRFPASWLKYPQNGGPILKPYANQSMHVTKSLIIAKAIRPSYRCPSSLLSGSSFPRMQPFFCSVRFISKFECQDSWTWQTPLFHRPTMRPKESLNELEIFKDSCPTRKTLQETRAVTDRTNPAIRNLTTISIYVLMLQALIIHIDFLQ